MYHFLSCNQFGAIMLIDEQKKVTFEAIIGLIVVILIMTKRSWYYFTMFSYNFC